MPKPLISVVLPCRNAETTLRESLDSILKQSLGDFEILMVDDGSTDKTGSIMARYRDPRVRKIRFPKSRGIAAALNAGLKAARGKFIARMDADDICYENRFRDQVAFFEKNKDISLAGTGARVFGAFQAVFRQPATHGKIVDEFLINNPFIHPTVMFRRELYDRGLYRYNEEYLTDEDYELWGRLLPVIQTANIGHSTIRYRRTAESNQSHPQVFEAKVRTLEHFCRRYGIRDKLDPSALAEVQCSGFVSHDAFRQLQRYASFAERTGKPKLGWLHKVFLREGSYKSVMNHYDQVFGYRPYGGVF
jgi:glycosyltransferase involved in cell wall biosynthesis